MVKYIKRKMQRKSSIAIFIAATSALAISSPLNAGEQDLGGLKEWNTDMSIDADFILDKEAQKIADEAAKSSVCIPCLLYTSPSPRDRFLSRMPSSA